MKSNLFHSEPDEREAYTIIIPPPNVTGILHMGHMLNNTIQDILVRRARLLGKNACWVPGTDHASIATEAKVVKKLKDEGMRKEDIGREEFIKHAWDWTDKYGGTILDQLKRLGASCDWERTRFTLENTLSESVLKVFMDLHQKGLVYRGVRMINWDPVAQTALSDEEVVHKEVNSKLYYINYNDPDGKDFITVATTRPETIFGDTAICVHPNDKRYTHLHGKKVLVPLIHREIPIIVDDYIDPDFGTGCLKVTPAHDINDYELGLRHKLESIDVLNDNGSLNEHAAHFCGMDRFEARKKIVEELREKGWLFKEEDLQNSMGFSERTDAVIEPKLSLQWFLKMESLAKPALEHVMDNTISFHPSKTKNAYRHWMENIKDWCISRQLWWGHQIPAYYYGPGIDDYVLAKDRDEASGLASLKLGRTIGVEELEQDEDVLDTWFSSWLWPMSVFDGIRNPENDDFKYYFPTNDLVTAPEIMFFWVARMIMASYEYQSLPPFRNVYFTGIVRDKQGRKMSKSLGNSPDPIELIEKYGADGVRVGMLLSSPAGNDLLFDESLCEQGKNFYNKLWNALKLIKSWQVDTETPQPETAKLAHLWLGKKISTELNEINENFDKFRISDSLMHSYKLAWDEFCSWYLEMIKPDYQKPIDPLTFQQAIAHFENILRILHAFMPFVTEEIWHLLKERKEGEFLMSDVWPKVEEDEFDLSAFDHVKEVVSQIRAIRTKRNIPNKNNINLQILAANGYDRSFDSILIKLGKLDEIEYVKNKPAGALSFIVNLNEYFIPLEEDIDLEEEKNKLVDEINYLEGFLKGVEKKLSNQRFVENAPSQVVELEKKKKADTEAKLAILKERIGNINK